MKLCVDREKYGTESSNGYEKDLPYKFLKV
jgi:hypothetical protein